MNDARQIAYEILLRIQKENAYSNLVLDSALETAGLEARDNSLVSALVYGTLERIITIDYNLSLYLNSSICKLKPEVLTVLRIGTCQILFMDKIPVSAAVNESIKIIKLTRCSFASGLVNAILRKIAEFGLVLPKHNNNDIEYFSVKYSCPQWIVSLWINSYGIDNTIGIMEYYLNKAPLIVRINTMKTTSLELIKLLESEGISSKICNEVENALILERAGFIENLSSFKNGLFHLQDTSSQICCKVLEVKHDDVVFDLCSAPGGKAFTIAEIMDGTGRVYAFDIYDARLELIRIGALRLNLSNVFTEIGDACIYNDKIGLADKVLCDVPCSGLGIIRRKPEIRYKSEENIDKLPELQYFILCNASRYVKIGGILAYSTCTLNPKENEDVCDYFIRNHPNYYSENISNKIINGMSNGKYLTLMPHMSNSDGFFIALFKRTE